jgi:hypothetical protein
MNQLLLQDKESYVHLAPSYPKPCANGDQILRFGLYLPSHSKSPERPEPWNSKHDRIWKLSGEIDPWKVVSTDFWRQSGTSLVTGKFPQKDRILGLTLQSLRANVYERELPKLSKPRWSMSLIFLNCLSNQKTFETTDGRRLSQNECDLVQYLCWYVVHMVPRSLVKDTAEEIRTSNSTALEATVKADSLALLFL